MYFQSLIAVGKEGTRLHFDLYLINLILVYTSFCYERSKDT